MAHKNLLIKGGDILVVTLEDKSNLTTTLLFIFGTWKTLFYPNEANVLELTSYAPIID
jgi:hypothetical protein